MKSGSDEIDASHRLSTRQMAEFTANGFLRFDGLVPDEINGAVIDELQRVMTFKVGQFIGEATAPADDLPQTGDRLSSIYPPPSKLGEYLRLPQVQGIVESLVGHDPIYDHDFVHYLPAGSTYDQSFHVDAITDSAEPSFDIQLFYFPTPVAPGAGGTRFLPGSHITRVRAEGISRYQHVVGEQQYAGPAGTVLVFHHGLWHSGRANPSSDDRWMHKVRLNPRVAQQRLWDLSDFDAIHNDPSDHTFAVMRFDSVGATLRSRQPWQAETSHRNGLVQKARLWRYLTGDENYDVDHYLTRLEQRAGLGHG